uniref:Aspartic peptidase DDI1-type domain-containing protein n=1 Tax=Manihot esculenta TaxID=3983 RepID=A0A2C9WGC9_MANES
MEGDDPSVVGALRFLGALEKKKEQPIAGRGLMYVEMTINGKSTRALIDTGATDNFVADSVATRFKLRVQVEKGKIKAVNSEALNTVGVAHAVSCEMGPWKGELTFTVTPLDDFDVVIGMDFLKKARAVPVPAANCLLLMGDKPYVVPTTFSPSKILEPLES